MKSLMADEHATEKPKTIVRKSISFVLSCILKNSKELENDGFKRIALESVNAITKGTIDPIVKTSKNPDKNIKMQRIDNFNLSFFSKLSQSFWHKLKILFSFITFFVKKDLVKTY